MKHFAIVSIDKDDLGRVQNFFHKIHLKDNEPVYPKQFKIPDAHRPFLEESLAEWLNIGVVAKIRFALQQSSILCPQKRREWLQNCPRLQRTEPEIISGQIRHERYSRMHG